MRAATGVSAVRRWLAARAPDRAVRSALDVGGELVREVRADRVTGLAAEVAFYAVLAIFPGILAVAAALGSLGSVLGGRAADDVQEAVVGFLEDVLTAEASDTIDAVRRLFEQDNVGLFTVALIGALWALSRGFAAVINALDVVYDLEEHRSWARQRALALGLSAATVVVTALLLLVVVVGPLLGTGRDVADAFGLGSTFATVWAAFRWPVAVAVAVAWSAAVFHLAPNHRTPWRWDVPGALVTAAAWIAVTAGFRAYLTLAGATNQVFGLLGGALIMLVWLYLLGLGLLVGGEINAIIAARRRVPQPSQV